MNIPVKKRPITRSHDTSMTRSIFDMTRILNTNLTEHHDEALIVQEEPESKPHDDSTTKL